jgi:hypothetical protein
MTFDQTQHQLNQNMNNSVISKEFLIDGLLLTFLLNCLIKKSIIIIYYICLTKRLQQPFHSTG